MSAMVPSIEELSRPAKALIDSGAVTEFTDAEAILLEACPSIVVGPDASSYGHQAALLTAVETAARTFGQAPVRLIPAVGESRCLIPGLSGLTVLEAVLDAGGHLISDPRTTAPVIVIGRAESPSPIVLHVSWDHWFARVSPSGSRLRERGNMVLAPVAAAALAVTECFKRALGVEEACHRTRSLNLWQPEVRVDLSSHGDPDAESLGPVLRYLPSSLWLVGLGHLGQGHAWCLRLLPYLDPATCEIYLQDYDMVNVANRTTGMFVRAGDVGQMKSRVVSAILERAGFTTRIIERPLLPETKRDQTEPALALIGVDKVEPRRIISGVGWAFAVDVGLGAGPTDFTGISLHTFPAPTPSSDVAAWQGTGSTDRAERARRQGAYRNASAAGADACGLIQLAEAAVAVPSVGVVAASLALAEPLRVLHGQHPHTTLGFDAGRSAPVRSTDGTTRPRIVFQAALPPEG